MNNSTQNPYIQDILNQPDSLTTALAQFDPAPLQPLAQAILRGEFDRIVLTGMGASLFAAYPSWLTLAGAGLPAIWADTAELIHHMPGLVTPRTLLWLFSQSGKSAEIVSALDFGLRGRPAGLLATVNDPESPLAQAVEKFGGLAAHIPIRAVVEKTVSTRTYTHTLAASQLAALALLGREVESARAELLQSAASMLGYLETWEERVKRMGEQIGFPKRLAILGRGTSMASVYTGTLILGEASKFAAIPYQAGEFRHGPLELAGPDLSVLIFAGPPETQHLNLQLLKDLRSYNTPAFWIGPEANEWQIQMAKVPAIGMPLAEILVIQLLTIRFARQIGVEPGHFFRSGKVTLTE